MGYLDSCLGKVLLRTKICHLNSTQFRLFGKIVPEVFGTDFGLSSVRESALFGFFEGVSQSLKNLYVPSVLLQFFLCLHDGGVELAVGFGFGEEFSVVVEESA